MQSFFENLISGISVVLNPHLELAISWEEAAILFNALLILIVLLVLIAAFRNGAPVKFIIFCLFTFFALRGLSEFLKFALFLNKYFGINNTQLRFEYKFKYKEIYNILIFKQIFLNL